MSLLLPLCAELIRPFIGKEGGAVLSGGGDNSPLGPLTGGGAALTTAQFLFDVIS
jgi:hypothetical protein